jgi:EAL domain-containing protein (putative c-di-GMP-specific phosphodiesterase class I)
MLRRVVITGTGVVHALGQGTPDFWNAIKAGKNGIGRITKFDSSRIDTKVSSEVTDFDPTKYVDKKDAKRLDPFIQYAIAASCMAIEESGIRIEGEDPFRTGVLIGSGIGGFEALARLNSEKYGLVSPLEFISIAEKSNMIVSIGEKIIHQAFNFLVKLKENGHETITLSVNVSTIQMLDKGFANRLLNLARNMRINPENIGIELTESIFATEWSEINTVIAKFKSYGIKILMDDFGTGYSSFARERELNINYIKIDKSFIDRLLVLRSGEAITGDIISMAHKLGHCVVAEGVEHEKQLSYLRDHGCDRIQGYLISKPVDEEEAMDWVNKKEINNDFYSSYSQHQEMVR